jgi:hypothetical protein
MEALIQAFPALFELWPNLGSHNPPGALIRDAEDNFSATLVGRSTCVFGEAIEVILGLPLLELAVLAFDAIKDLLEA